jgi:cell division protein FtsB
MTQLTKNPPEERGRGIVALAFRSRRKIATAAALALAALIGYHVMFGQNGITAYEAKRKEAKMLDEQLEVSRQQNARLKAHVERLKSDPDAIEHEAREQLHYARPGEVIYTVPAPAAGHAASQ